MASYRPKNEIYIAEPCSESWDEMQGDAGKRHCAACACDVHNLAALTPRQIEELVSRPGAMPCLRIAQFEDGSLLVAEEHRATAPYGMLAGAAMAALVTISSSVANAQQQPPRLMGKIAPLRGTYSGQVLDAAGRPAAGTTVYVVRRDTGYEEREEVKTDAEGNFHLTVRTGAWQLGATAADGQQRSAMEEITLTPGQHTAARPVKLRVLTVTAGVPAIMPRDKPAKGK